MNTIILIAAMCSPADPATFAAYGPPAAMFYVADAPPAPDAYAAETYVSHGEGRPVLVVPRVLKRGGEAVRERELFQRRPVRGLLGRCAGGRCG